MKEIPSLLNGATKAYYEFVELLDQLHVLELAGRGADSDDPHYESICDQMNEPWYAMSDDEQAAVSRRSADLLEISNATKADREEASQ